MRKIKFFSLLAGLFIATTSLWADPAVAVNGKLPGAFSVSATKQVYFSQGNLQYKAITNTWCFAEEQYDYVGDATYGNVYENSVKCDNSLISSTYTGWIDLFGWATSGWNNGNRNAYQPYSTSGTNSDYGVEATKSKNETLTGDYANGDWGVYNADQLGDGWRTLTIDEWYYMLTQRTTSATIQTTANARFIEAQILTDAGGAQYSDHHIQGLIIFPDDFDGSKTYNGVTWGTKVNNSATFGLTTCTTAGWAALEEAGCVFLPAAGARTGTTGYEPGSFGYYWSTTASHVGPSKAYYFDFHDEWVGVNPLVQDNLSLPRSVGSSVRLVSDTPPSAPVKTDASVTTAPTPKTPTYDGTSQVLINDDGVADGGTFEYSLDGTTWSDQLPTAPNAGTYTVYYKIIGDANHNDFTPSPNTISVTINKAALTVTADNKAVTCGEAAPAYTASYSGFVGGETEAVLGGTLAFACGYTTTSAAGDYTITPSGLTSDNYTITFQTGTLTATAAAPVVVTIDVPTHQDPLNSQWYYTTFYHGTQNYALTNDATEAFVADLSGTDLVLTKIAEGEQVIPANTGVIFRKSYSADPVVLAPTDAAGVSFTANNDLKGVDVQTDLTAIDGLTAANCYILSGQADDHSVVGVGFYKVNKSYLKEHKAYVKYVGTPSSAPKRMRFVFEQENTATGMECIQPSDVSCQKVLRDGQLIILRNGVEYNANGQIVK